MTQLGDIRNSVVYQELRDEVRFRAWKQGWRQGRNDAETTVVLRLSLKGQAAQEICDLLGLEESRVNENLASTKP